MDQPVTFPENWKPPVELSRALPREVRLATAGVFRILLAALLLVSSIPLYLYIRQESVAQAAKNQALREHGVEATGEINQLWHQGRGRTPMVAYSFTASGVRFRGDAAVPKDWWDRVRLAGMIPIRYLASDPRINHPAQWEGSVTGEWVTYVVPAIMILAAIFLIVTTRRQARLLAEGVPAPGVVTRCYRVKGGWSASYQFRTKEGVVASGRNVVRRRLDAGANVCVLYDPENPRRSGTYPLSAYRVA